MLFPILSPLENYIIYGAFAFILIVFFIVALQPKKKTEPIVEVEIIPENHIYVIEAEPEKLFVLDPLEGSINTNELDSAKTIQDLFPEIVPIFVEPANDVDAIRPIADEAKTTQLSFLHKNFEDEVKDEVELHDAVIDLHNTLASINTTEQDCTDMFNSMTVVELRSLAKDAELKGYTKLRKKELIQVLIDQADIN